jgi:hypothetical protein
MGPSNKRNFSALFFLTDTQDDMNIFMGVHRLDCCTGFAKKEDAIHRQAAVE